MEYQALPGIPDAKIMDMFVACVCVVGGGGDLNIATAARCVDKYGNNFERKGNVGFDFSSAESGVCANTDEE